MNQALPGYLVVIDDWTATMPPFNGSSHGHESRIWNMWDQKA